jgi:hypothetical protein
MTSGLPILVSLASLALSIYVFFDQRKMKRSDVFESRWFRLLDHLKTMKFASESGFESDFVGGLCLTLGFAERDGDISLQDVADRLSRAGRLVGGATPDGLYGTFQALAALREEKSLDKRTFLDRSLFAYIDDKHVAHAFHNALRRTDEKTIMFLIETNLISKFAAPWINDHIDILKRACIAKSTSAFFSDTCSRIVPY